MLRNNRRNLVWKLHLKLASEGFQPLRCRRRSLPSPRMPGGEFLQRQGVGVDAPVRPTLTGKGDVGRCHPNGFGRVDSNPNECAQEAKTFGCISRDCSLPPVFQTSPFKLIEAVGTEREELLVFDGGEKHTTRFMFLSHRIEALINLCFPAFGPFAAILVDGSSCDGLGVFRQNFARRKHSRRCTLSGCSPRMLTAGKQAGILREGTLRGQKFGSVGPDRLRFTVAAQCPEQFDMSLDAGPLVGRQF
ncbi:MAG: hypothetical protein E6Q97_20615 [Desulfurellales bacterium]|nr:MAG: hypothetical protein E6Q97_20615 [Desulfurellales bacterium]